MDHAVQAAVGGVHAEGHHVPESGREPGPVGLGPARGVAGEPPDAGTSLELRAWIEARRPRGARLSHARVGGGADVYVQRTVVSEGDALGGVVARVREPGHQRVGRSSGPERSGLEGVAEHGVVGREVHGAVGEDDVVSSVLTPGLPDVRKTVPVAVPQHGYPTGHAGAGGAGGRVPPGHEHVAVRSDVDVPGPGHTVGHQNGTEAFGNLDAGVLSGATLCQGVERCIGRGLTGRAARDNREKGRGQGGLHERGRSGIHHAS